REERGLLARNDDDDAAGLPPVARHLRDDLAGRDAERAREARPGTHGGLDSFRDDASLEEVGRDLAHVEVALVEPRLLDRRDDSAHRLPDVPRVLAVE